MDPVLYHNMNSSLEGFANKAFDSSIRSIKSEVCDFDSSIYACKFVELPALNLMPSPHFEFYSVIDSP